MQEMPIETFADDLAKEQGYLVRKVKWIGRRSAPDKLYSREDTGPFFIEFKKTGKEPTVTQAREIQRMRDAGIKVFTVDSIRGVRELFSR